MSEREEQVRTSAGVMPAFVAHPDEGGPFPVVVVYMDALGVRESLRDIGRRIAAEGYFAAVPDLYHPFGEGITFDASKLGDPETGEMQRMQGLIARIDDRSVIDDTRALLGQLASDSLASSGPKGCVGFCLGGRLVVRAMTSLPDEFIAGSALHPSFIVSDGADSPHLKIGEMRGELYIGLGGADAFQPPEAFEPARAELDRHGIAYAAEVHEGAEHGYMIPGAPAHHDAASERSWERTFDLFRRTLQGAAVAS
ncbi:MAG: dienelactone hydrolase family protein [Solirubrobacteraceae bacterium]